MQGGADWHIYPSGGLCLDLPSRWDDRVYEARLIFELNEAAMFAAEYFFNSAQWLLNHHRYAHQEGLTEWPKDWAGWAHYGVGPREYFKLSHAA